MSTAVKVLLGVVLGFLALIAGCAVLIVVIAAPSGGGGESGEQSPRKVKATARKIPYKQLAKDPDRYAGEAVTYRGQVLQVQESGGSGFMLLSVTRDEYGVWDDEVYVNYDESTSAAEEDVVKIYGTVTGGIDYDTQIGGSNYVPEIQATTIEE